MSSIGSEKLFSGQRKGSNGRRRTSVLRYAMARVVLVLLLVVALGGLSTLSLHSLMRDEDALTRVHLPTFRTAARLSDNAAALAALSARQLAVETRAELSTLFDRIADRARMAQEDVDRLAELGLDPAPLAQVRATQQALYDSALRLDALLREIAGLRRGGADAAQFAPLLRQRTLLLQRQELVASELTTLVSALAHDTGERMTAFQARAAEKTRLLLALAIVAALAAVATVLAVYRGMRRNILDRLRALTTALADWQAGRYPAFSTAGPEDEITGISRILADLVEAVDRRTGELVEQAATDPLTGILNRRGFQAGAEREVALSHRYGTPLSLLIGDIDHFKTINDGHGHAVGDAVLRHVARLWRERLRDVDLCGRVGGEEFVALLPHTTAAGGRQVAERIRQSVAAGTAVTGDGPPVPCTISLGVAELDPGESLADLLARADLALYAAKSLGRDRVECAPADSVSLAGA